MKRFRSYVMVRHRNNWIQLFRFGLVGGSGVLVNMAVYIVAVKLGPHTPGVAVNLPLTEFNVRWYHVFNTIAFFAANFWNFQLNRRWTFKSSKHASWTREYWPFLAVGLIGWAAGLIIITLLVKQGSPLALPGWLDGSSGFRNRYYWAQLISIAVVTPLSFVVNKMWTFASVRGQHKLGKSKQGKSKQGEPEQGEVTSDSSLEAR